MINKLSGYILVYAAVLRKFVYGMISYIPSTKKDYLS